MVLTRGSGHCFIFTRCFPHIFPNIWDYQYFVKTRNSHAHQYQLTSNTTYFLITNLRSFYMQSDQRLFFQQKKGEIHFCTVSLMHSLSASKLRTLYVLHVSICLVSHALSGIMAYYIHYKYICQYTEVLHSFRLLIWGALSYLNTIWVMQHVYGIEELIPSMIHYYATSFQ